MTGYNGFFKTALYLVIATFIFGCTTMRSLSLANIQELQNQLEAGDEVKVTRKDGSAMTFGIDTVTETGISGDGTLVAWSDMQQIEVQEFSAGKTIGLVAGIAAAGLVATGGSDSGGSGY